jgi:hypothetical protein
MSTTKKHQVVFFLVGQEGVQPYFRFRLMTPPEVKVTRFALLVGFEPTLRLKRLLVNSQMHYHSATTEQSAPNWRSGRGTIPPNPHRQ